MSNTFTNLLPDIYAALNVVSRERVGLIPAVNIDARSSTAAVGTKVYASVAPAMSAADITPANVSPEGADRVVGNIEVEITKSRKVSFNLTGEEDRGLGEFNRQNIRQQTFQQAFRTLSNEVESDLFAQYVNASRAYGTAGTTPFGTGDDLTDLTKTIQILVDNGAPPSEMQAVLNSTAGMTLLGKQGAVFKVNEAGTELAQRQGQFQEMFGARIGITGQAALHVKGTGTGYDANGGEPIGEREIVLDGGTAGATGIKSGDVVTFAGDTNKYVVNTGISGAAGTVTLGAPGLLETLADTTEMTIGDSYLPSMVFSRDAIVLAARAPYAPQEGDSADDRIFVTDPVSGLVFEISLYRQYRQVSYEVGLAWGVKTANSAHLALLLG